jgi:hypothetical protein
MRLHLLSTLLLVACGSKDSADPGTSDTGDAPWRPDLVCPGDADCLHSDGPLEAGAAAVKITPTCFEAWLDCGDDGLCPGDEGYVEPDGGEGDAEYSASREAFLDCGCDRLCPDAEDYPGKDEGEADGVFQAMWLAGFQNGRPAASVHDDLWARAVVLRAGETTVALLSLDVVGFFYDDVLEIRQRVEAADVGVDHVIVTSTHVHEGPDTLGQWGKSFGQRGVDDDWLESIKDNAASAVVKAAKALVPATLKVTSADTSAYVADKGTQNLVDDHRDPRIVDEMMGVAWLQDQRGQTIATLVHFGNHPETLADENTAITSDFVHYVRDGMENGVEWESGTIPGKGGVSIFIQGSVGGMMTPLGVTCRDLDGNEFSASDFAKAQAIGHMMASQALESLDGATAESAPTLALRVAQMYLPITNTGFQALFIMKVLERAAYNYDPALPVSDLNRPDLLTEMDVFDLGPIRMLTVPGEILPELVIGGYDGSHTNIGESTDAIVDLDQPNAADLSSAPAGPYLADEMDAAHTWVIGLGNDEVGYIIPSYNFILSETLPYLDEADGDHYEETNSLGPETAPRVLEMATTLLQWSPSGG